MAVAGDRLQALWHSSSAPACGGRSRWPPLVRRRPRRRCSLRPHPAHDRGLRRLEREPRPARPPPRPLDADVVAACAPGEAPGRGAVSPTAPPTRTAGLVFTREDGAGYHPQRLVGHVSPPLREEAGLEAIRFHDLRHTAATSPWRRESIPRCPGTSRPRQRQITSTPTAMCSRPRPDAADRIGNYLRATVDRSRFPAPGPRSSPGAIPEAPPCGSCKSVVERSCQPPNPACGRDFGA